jgi:hypothetical protein
MQMGQLDRESGLSVHRPTMKQEKEKEDKNGGKPATACCDINIKPRPYLNL